MGLLEWNLSIIRPQTNEPIVTAPFCRADMIATSPMSPPRKITYNGITVLNPWAVIWDGNRYHIQRLFWNCIVWSKSEIGHYCIMHVKNFHSFVYSLLFVEKFYHAEVWGSHMVWYAQSMLTFVIIFLRGYLGMLLCGKFYLSHITHWLHDAYLGRMSFDREY